MENPQFYNYDDNCGGRGTWDHALEDHNLEFCDEGGAVYFVTNQPVEISSTARGGPFYTRMRIMMKAEAAAKGGDKGDAKKKGGEEDEERARIMVGFHLPAVSFYKADTKEITNEREMYCLVQGLVWV